MRVLVATDHWFPDHRGGAARVAAETAALLARAGHEVDVLAPSVVGLQPQERLGTLTVHRILRRGALPQTLTDPWSTCRAARGRRPDVVVAHTSTTAVGLAAARLRAPLVLVYHASAPRELRFERTRLRRRGRWLASFALEPALAGLERAAVARADRIVVLSEFSRSLLQADHPESLARVRVVGGGVDTSAFAPGDRVAARERLGVRADGELLVTVRRLEPRMGLERLLDAVAGLCGRGLELAIVGDGSLRSELERRRSHLGLERCVRLVGGVPEDELLEWYRAADLFVLPTLAYEGFGLATAEALACGTPVVGTPVGATPELLRPLDARLVAAGTDPRDLAEAIERGLALATPAFRSRCRERAQRCLSWQAVFPAWEAVVAGAPDVRVVTPPSFHGDRDGAVALRSGR